MAIVTGDRYLEKLVKFVEDQAGPLLDGTLVLKLNPAGLHYVQSRLEAFHELENLLSGAPVDYLRAYVSDLGDHRALEQLRRILRLLTSLKVVSVLNPPARDPTPLSLLPFGRLKVLELRGCNLSTSAAKGLLELRHTLEKIICHNSTDALRHIFASRIAEIKHSPQWNRLSFVSCACNRLVLMDESLQLLPAVETLDLSRNKFAKVDNLRKCVKLKHLDLGFNHLRSIAPLSQISCNIVQMVLRNNVLTTLHGLESLKSLEALDVSYNIISNFSELEFLIGLTSLQSLWLEGNPLCCARWYRAHVFSYFVRPDALKLDDKEISTREFWKRQLIIASRQKRPSSFGFYYPAKNEAETEEAINKKRRKVSRVASIESKGDSMCMFSDEESPSCDNEIQNKEENISDDEAEINDLMSRVELLKKERSVLWLREFKEWLDHASEHIVDRNTCGGATPDHANEKDLKRHPSDKHLGESSKYALDSLQTSGDETSTIVVESDNSFIDMSTSSYGGVALPGMGRVNQKQNYEKSYSHEGLSSVPALPKTPHLDGFSGLESRTTAENRSLSSMVAIDDMTESHSSSVYPGSPPHYQEDILHRRQNLVEEILQLSAESFSIISSDSHTSSSEDDLYDLVDDVQSKNEKCLYTRAEGDSSLNRQDYLGRENDGCLVGSYSNPNSWTPEIVNSNNGRCSDFSHDKIAHSVNLENEGLEKEINQRKPRRRTISLFEHGFDKLRTSNVSNGIMDTSIREVDDQYKRIIDRSHFDAVIDKKRLQADSSKAPLVTSVGNSDDFVERYFNAYVADCRVNETCKSYMRCDCVLEPESLYREREVVLLLSSENKLYVLLIGVPFEGSETVLSLLGRHKIEDTREVLLGFGLQIVRVHIERGATYLFLTRSVEKSRQLLSTLQLLGPRARNDKCRLSSLELVQVALFEKQICGGLKMSIFQYSLVLFLHEGNEGESWLPRSLFVSAEHLLVCVEDLRKFSCPSKDASSPPYFSIDSCCTIGDVYELVIEAKESQCVTLGLERSATKFSLPSKAKEAATTDKGHIASGSLRWKIKWFSEESLLNFVALVKAIHAGLSASPLPVTKCVS